MIPYMDSAGAPIHISVRRTKTAPVHRGQFLPFLRPVVHRFLLGLLYRRLKIWLGLTRFIGIPCMDSV